MCVKKGWIKKARVYLAFINSVTNSSVFLQLFDDNFTSDAVCFVVNFKDVNTRF